MKHVLATVKNAVQEKMFVSLSEAIFCLEDKIELRQNRPKDF